MNKTTRKVYLGFFSLKTIKVTRNVGTYTT